MISAALAVYDTDSVTEKIQQLNERYSYYSHRTSYVPKIADTMTPLEYFRKTGEIESIGWVHDRGTRTYGELVNPSALFSLCTRSGVELDTDAVEVLFTPELEPMWNPSEYIFDKYTECRIITLLLEEL